jgi:L-fuconolactonase
MSNEHEAWLGLTKEDPIEPELPICDPHHHLWGPPRGPYFLEEFLQDARGHNIVHTVFVECESMYRESGPEEMRPLGETEFVESIANQSASGQYGKTRVAAGIVGYVDLKLGTAAAPVFEAHMAASKRFRGIRYISPWDANFDQLLPPALEHLKQPPKILLEPKLREGFAYLQKYGLSFDAWFFHTQMMDLVDLARAFPDVTTILDHIGTPLGIGPYAGKREEVFQEWKKGIAAVATCPNVLVKLGALGMHNSGFGWDERTTPPGSVELSEAMAPYFLWCIEQFGTERCMFESNFPPDKVSYSYTVLWNAFKRITKGFSPEERANLFYNTATKAYRL